MELRIKREEREKTYKYVELAREVKKNLLNIVTGKLTKIPKRDFIFARVKTGQVGT